MENHHFSWILPWKIVISHSYVSLPEGTCVSGQIMEWVNVRKQGYFNIYSCPNLSHHSSDSQRGLFWIHMLKCLCKEMTRQPPSRRPIRIATHFLNLWHFYAVIRVHLTMMGFWCAPQTIEMHPHLWSLSPESWYSYYVGGCFNFFGGMRGRDQWVGER